MIVNKAPMLVYFFHCGHYSGVASIIQYLKLRYSSDLIMKIV